MTQAKEFSEFFAMLATSPAMNDVRYEPHDWQRDFAELRDAGNRLVRVPTGFGKTLGVLSGMGMESRTSAR